MEPSKTKQTRWNDTTILYNIPTSCATHQTLLKPEIRAPLSMSFNKFYQARRKQTWIGPAVLQLKAL